MTNVLIVDDHAVVRRGLRMVLSLKPDIQVVGEAGSGEEALAHVAEAAPDLVLLDLLLPDTDGALLAPQIRAICPGCRILILSGVESAPLVRRAVEAGVDGYILKEVTPDELVAAIQEVMAGQSYLHPKITELLSRQVQVEAQETGPPSAPDLTPREQEVLQLLATTATNREIAERLVVSEETVRSHVKNILRKLNQSSRTQAVVEALRLGLIQL